MEDRDIHIHPRSATFIRQDAALWRCRGLALIMRTSFVKPRKRLKSNGLSIALIALLFVVSIVENGFEGGMWVAVGSCYALALFCFCAAAVPALILRHRLSWIDWSCLGFAIVFVLAAHALGAAEVIEVGLYGVVCGSIFGLYLLYLETRSH